MSGSVWPFFGGGSRSGVVGGESGRVRAERDVFRHESGAVWSWQGATMFLLFRRYLLGEDIAAQIDWMRAHRVNVARVLGMVAWPGSAFGPAWPGYFDKLSAFIQLLGANGLRCEFVVFADAQVIVPDHQRQRQHLRAVMAAIGHEPNVFLECSNEPGLNGVEPFGLIGRDEPRPCPMAYGEYGPLNSTILPTLDYLTVHLSRDVHAWARKAKDILEFRTGGVYVPPIDPTHVPVVSDEPMGAAETDRYPGGPRSTNPDDHFWHHAICRLFGAGSTFHYQDGLQGLAPAPGSTQQACAEAVARVWSLIAPEVQTWNYTRSGLPECPLAFNPAFFPEETSRIYAQIGGDQAVAVAVRPDPAWRPVPSGGWRIVSVDGPVNSLVHLRRL